MRSIIKPTYLIATTILCTAPAAIAIPFQQQVLTNGINAAYVTPGLGVEFEVISVSYDSTKKVWDAFDTLEREALKGKKVTPQGFSGGPQTNWKLTAEISPQNLITEIIVDGEQNKVGAGTSALIGGEIANYMTNWWALCGGGGCLADVQGDPVAANPWKVKWRLAIDSPLFVFYPQVTTAMPMEGVLQVLEDSKIQNKGNILINQGSDYNTQIILLTAESFGAFKAIRREDIDAEFLGFFSLLTSYCAIASEGKPEHGPKRGLNIMPRTNFLTMYKAFASHKLQAQFAQGTSLYDIVRELASKGSNGKQTIEGKKFKWLPEDLRRDIVEEWPGKAAARASGNLPVKEFLDTLQPLPPSTLQLDLLMLMDEMVRHGQIGGLGDRMEGVYGASEKPAPIFEFRDLMPVKKGDLATRLEQFDQQVVALHRKVTHPTLDRQETGQKSNAKSEHQDQKFKTTEGTVPPPAKQHSCETETEAEKPRQGVTPPKDESWWLLSVIRHYSGPSKWFPTEL
ncbi:uncharacterized protein TRIVIDRAFT_68618 [Trichoderma virens Gv29-8]|uniref:Uncharacterized protein n=1 Tax=Hypocrea virens (strain Gv29-8 / FGSC 10586) TaxID=413071 RepID=G9MZI4_HYPVG|nr:uncharacterized protein TRIVIDRAFT_68618 [Trichoderma virens Gv29-8]EHK20040.1 hypothetical protein TRIVIDRAFT_68618 [Trichoderma virens Gv29-8]UKZ46015.1 hypothetical protein TrVGV298_000212 [Trichoderma virens]